MEKITHKYCSECNSWLQIEEFKKLTTKSALRHNPDGYYWCCSTCYKRKTWVFDVDDEPNNRQARRRDKRARRVESIEYKYGLSEVEYAALISKQNNLCAVCGEKQERKVLCVDHDHKTGKVRGLLCGNCNVGLGNFRDNIRILQSAIGYLKSSIDGEVEKT